jgi:20S proteasome alpha/beta subunit
MTVCVAAICSSKTAVVCAADHAVSRENMGSETIDKIVQVEDSCVALIAGNVPLQTEILIRVQRAIKNREPIGKPSVEEMAEFFEDAYLEIWQKGIENEVLRYYGISREIWEHGQATLSNETIQAVRDGIENLPRRDVATIVAGVDDTGAHLWTVTNGSKECFDMLGYACIGEGAELAVLEFLKVNYQPDAFFTDAIYCSWIAKKQAERVYGVGNRTGFSYVSHAGCSVGASGIFNDRLYEMLDKTYEQMSFAETLAFSNARKRVIEYAQGFFNQEEQSDEAKEIKARLEGAIEHITANIGGIRDELEKR